jgi:hypothetical protein
MEEEEDENKKKKKNQLPGRERGGHHPWLTLCSSADFGILYKHAYFVT